MHASQWLYKTKGIVGNQLSRSNRLSSRTKPDFSKLRIHAIAWSIDNLPCPQAPTTQLRCPLWSLPHLASRHDLSRDARAVLARLSASVRLVSEGIVLIPHLPAKIPACVSPHPCAFIGMQVYPGRLSSLLARDRVSTIAGCYLSLTERHAGRTDHKRRLADGT